jgi:hypothetical protein
MSSPATRRRSSRLAQQAAQAIASTSASNDDSGTSTDVDHQPKRKHARLSLDSEDESEEELEEEKLPRMRGNRGKLQKLTEIPLDVLFEVRDIFRSSTILQPLNTVPPDFWLSDSIRRAQIGSYYKRSEKFAHEQVVEHSLATCSCKCPRFTTTFGRHERARLR